MSGSLRNSGDLPSSGVANARTPVAAASSTGAVRSSNARHEHLAEAFVPLVSFVVSQLPLNVQTASIMAR